MTWFCTEVWSNTTTFHKTWHNYHETQHFRLLRSLRLLYYREWRIWKPFFDDWLVYWQRLMKLWRHVFWKGKWHHRQIFSVCNQSGSCVSCSAVSLGVLVWFWISAIVAKLFHTGWLECLTICGRNSQIGYETAGVFEEELSNMESLIFHTCPKLK